MDDFVRKCKGCRHEFTVDHRNRGRTVHRQEYCGKPACRKKSQSVSKARYRVAEPEDKEQVSARVQRLRKGRHEHEKAGSQQTPSFGLDSLDGGVQRAVPPGNGPVQSTADLDVIKALARRLIGAADQIAALIAPAPGHRAPVTGSLDCF